MLGDQEKILFLKKGGMHRYKVMSFDLKIAWAIYQQLMAYLFHDQISRSVKIYLMCLSWYDVSHDDA